MDLSAKTKLFAGVGGGVVLFVFGFGWESLTAAAALIVSTAVLTWAGGK